MGTAGDFGLLHGQSTGRHKRRPPAGTSSRALSSDDDRMPTRVLPDRCIKNIKLAPVAFANARAEGPRCHRAQQNHHAFWACLS
jgi:hypothetical protein